MKYLLGNDGAMECYNLAMYNYFGEPLNLESFSLDVVEKMLGNDGFNQIYPCALEFFFSNEYQPSDGTQKHWNVIDGFIEAKGNSLLQAEKEYLMQLRNSYMNLYEVIEVIPKKAIILKDLIEPGELIEVREKKATQYLVKWDRVGARLLKFEDKMIMSGGVLLIKKDTSEEVIEQIRFIDKGMQKLLKKEMNNIPETDAGTLRLLQKKMWAKEIGESWMFDIITNKQKPQTYNFINNTGDKLQFVSLKFTLREARKQILAALYKLKELVPADAGRGKAVFYWIQSPKEKKAYGKKGSDKDNSSLAIETYVCSPEGNNYPLFAEIILQNKELVVNINSSQRANILEDYIESNLGNMVGKAEWRYEDMEKLIKMTGQPKADSSVSGLSPTEESKIIQEIYSTHYLNWLDNELEILGNKTPRQAVRTKKGKAQFISLLKSMENHNLSNKKHNNLPDYDFSQLWKELDLSLD